MALDAGTLCSQLKKINFQDSIHAYLLSHAHLDHISGLVICSLGDGENKEIIGLDSTINYLRDYIFNWKIWPNFADEGEPPQLKKYKFHRLMPGKMIPIVHTQLQVQGFVLNHGNDYPSTAFLLQSDDHYLLYFGDTGPDAVAVFVKKVVASNKLKLPHPLRYFATYISVLFPQKTGNRPKIQAIKTSRIVARYSNVIC